MGEQLYHFKTDKIDAYFHKDPEDKDRYLVISCARGENDYIVEFVEHYLRLGFDKIIICDNNDDDSVSDILRYYIQDNKVEIFNCHGFNSFQVQLYAMFVQEANFKWCAFFDCDEFLELGCYSNIKDFLETVNEDLIAFHWLVYGSGGQYHKELGTIQERFTEPVKPIMMFKENSFIKSIVRGNTDKWKGCWFNGSHIPYKNTGDYKYNIGGMYICDWESHNFWPPKYRCGYIKHYYTKSFDEWIKKSSRGWPDGTPTLTTSNFFLCDNKTNYPITNYVESFFCTTENMYKLAESWSDFINKDKYDVYHIKNPNHHIYALIVQLISLMRGLQGQGLTFILSDEHINDSTFAMFLEYAIETGNRVVYARNQDEVLKAVQKYSTKPTYYCLNLC